MTAKPEIDVGFSFDRIFHTDEQCRALNQEYIRVEEKAPPNDGIAVGISAFPREFPFYVAIYSLKPNETEYTHDCGGSIIAKR